LSPTREGILLHVAIGVPQCQLTRLFKGYVYNLSCYPLKPRKTLIYGGWVDTLEGAPTLNGVRSNWDFTLVIPPICWQISSTVNILALEGGPYDKFFSLCLF